MACGTPNCISLPVHHHPRRPVWRRLIALILEWDSRHRQRRALERLDRHMLRDIGLDIETARGEAARPFWRR